MNEIQEKKFNARELFGEYDEWVREKEVRKKLLLGGFISEEQNQRMISSESAKFEQLKSLARQLDPSAKNDEILSPAWWKKMGIDGQDVYFKTISGTPS